MRLAILHAGALGDLVLAMYVVEHLRGYEIVLIARSELARWFVGRTSVTEAFDFDGPRVHTLFVEGGPVDAEITEALAMCDRIVSFCGRGPSVLVQQLRSVCPNRVDAIDPTVRSETIRAHRHITQQWADDLQQPLDLSVDLRSPLLHVHDDDVRFGEQRWQAMAATAGRRVLVHPGSGGRAKCWPIERFEALVDCLREAGWMVAWLIGPTEHEMFGPSFVDRLHRRGPVFEQESLVELASIIATADVYVGNDAGPTHLAAALGRPTVAIFGPTPPSVWRPLGENIHVVCGNAPADDPFSGITVAQITNIVTGYSLAR